MKYPVKITFFMVLLFLCSQLAGLAVVYEYIDVVKSEETGVVEWKELPAVGPVELERPQVEERYSYWFILGVVIVGTFLVFVLFWFGKPFIWKVWYFLAAVLCLYISFSAFVGNLFGGLFALVVSFFKTFRHNFFVHNFGEVFLYGGIAALIVPIFSVKYAVFLLLLMSLYDFVAVRKTKHMVDLAKFQAEAGVFAGLLFPYGKGQLKFGEGSVAMLGGGDIGFPLIFAGVVLKQVGVLQSLFVVLFSTLAISFLFFVARKKKFYPAIPYLTVGCLLGYFVGLLFF